MKTSPTQRSLKLLRSEGWLCAVVEKWNPHAKIRQDLFGFIDVLAIKDHCILGVQTTSGSNMAARIAKISTLDAARIWLKSSYRFIEVHGWRKAGVRGARKLWDCRRIPIERLQ